MFLSPIMFNRNLVLISSALLNSSLKKRVKDITVMNIYGVACTNEENPRYIKSF